MEISILEERAKMAAKEVEKKTVLFATSLKPLRRVEIVENIFRVIFSSCRGETKKHFQSNAGATEEMKRVIGYYAKKELPIPISITFALYMRSKNILKFSEWEKNVPHLGWVDFLARLKYLDSKLKIVYEPGCKIFIFEEASLLYSVIGWRKEEVEKFRSKTDKIISGLELSEILVVFPMNNLGLQTFDEWRDKYGWKSTFSVEDAVIFAMMTSCSGFADRDVMDLLYRTRSRNYDEIRRKNPQQWEISKQKAAYIRSVMETRKEKNLWGKSIESFYANQGIAVGEKNFLDAVITSKEGRLALNMGGIFPNHGMAVANGDKHLLENIPEYRIEGASPIKISEGGEEFIFFYQKD